MDNMKYITRNEIAERLGISTVLLRQKIREKNIQVPNNKRLSPTEAELIFRGLV